MGRTAAIRKKEKSVLELVHQLFDAGHTLDEVLGHLRALGVEDVSRSALGRERQRYEAASAVIRQHQDLSEMIVREYGQEGGKQMRANIQLMHALISRLSAVLSSHHVDDVDIKDIAQLAQSLAALGRAEKTDAEVRAKIREEARKEMATAATTAAREAGADDGVIASIAEHLAALQRSAA